MEKLDVPKRGIIYYTDQNIREPIASVVRQKILESGLPIVSCSLNFPLDFGKNIVIRGQRGYPTMIRQILTALEMSDADYVFFCEHDVLYPKEHFDFTPSKDNIFFYNENVWRWWFLSDHAINHIRMIPLSCLCVNRQYALNHYEMRQKKIEEAGLDKFKSKEPQLARIWGYEPGTKKKKRGGLTDDNFETWKSALPVIDIRHSGTFSSPKCTLDSFKHLPEGWREIPIEEIPGWNLKELFKQS